MELSGLSNFVYHYNKNFDNLLLKYYKIGWKDEENGTTSVVLDSRVLNKAYKLGATHCGDDMSSHFDTLSDEEILKMIKNDS